MYMWVVLTRAGVLQITFQFKINLAVIAMHYPERIPIEVLNSRIYPSDLGQEYLY